MGDVEQFWRLLYLPPGQMLKKSLTMSLLDDDETASDGFKSPWFQFPASFFTDPVLQPSNSDMDKVNTGLYMLDNLLPGPLRPLLPPGFIHLHGEILLENGKNTGVKYSLEKHCNWYPQTNPKKNPIYPQFSLLGVWG
jgi:hypothetical protein